jgi:hypothetical protein
VAWVLHMQQHSLDLHSGAQYASKQTSWSQNHQSTSLFKLNTELAYTAELAALHLGLP